jgi:hypothetical protein
MQTNPTYAIQYDVDNLIPNFATCIVPTPTQDYEQSKDKHWDTLRQDIAKPTRNIATPVVRISNKVKTNTGTP